jgi:hypothetical protein
MPTQKNLSSYTEVNSLTQAEYMKLTKDELHQVLHTLLNEPVTTILTQLNYTDTTILTPLPNLTKFY